MLVDVNTSSSIGLIFYKVDHIIQAKMSVLTNIVINVFSLISRSRALTVVLLALPPFRSVTVILYFSANGSGSQDNRTELSEIPWTEFRF